MITEEVAEDAQELREVCCYLYSRRKQMSNQDYCPVKDPSSSVVVSVVRNSPHVKFELRSLAPAWVPNFEGCIVLLKQRSDNSRKFKVYRRVTCRVRFGRKKTHCERGGHRNKGALTQRRTQYRNTQLVGPSTAVLGSNECISDSLPAMKPQRRRLR